MEKKNRKRNQTFVSKKNRGVGRRKNNEGG